MKFLKIIIINKITLLSDRNIPIIITYYYLANKIKNYLEHFESFGESIFYTRFWNFLNQDKNNTTTTSGNLYVGLVEDRLFGFLFTRP